MEINFNSHFSMQLANKVLLENIDEGLNVVLSPLSFQLMLSLTAVGSTGKTLEQMLSHLGSPSIDNLNVLSSKIVNLISTNNSPNSSPLLYVVNKLWVKESLGIKPSFQKIAQDFYKAKAKGVDFGQGDEVVNVINSWVEDATEGLITKLIPSGSFDSNTAFVFTNAIYFKGIWDRIFDKTQTTLRDFHLPNGHVIHAPFMTGVPGQKHLYKSFDGYKVLNIPYISNQDKTCFSMYFFLPDDINGLPNMLQKINSYPGFFNQNFDLREENLFQQLWIPKFKFSFEFEASNTLKTMGMIYPFLERGDFTGMADDPRILLSKMFHKSSIEFNEEGTEAAASTAPVIIMQCLSTISPRFVADHPFMFMIREENSGVVLFIGTVLNPLLAT